MVVKITTTKKKLWKKYMLVMLTSWMLSRRVPCSYCSKDHVGDFEILGWLSPCPDCFHRPIAIDVNTTSCQYFVWLSLLPSFFNFFVRCIHRIQQMCFSFTILFNKLWNAIEKEKTNHFNNNDIFIYNDVVVAIQYANI